MITQAEFGFVRTSLSTEDPKYQEVSPINFNRDDYGVIKGTIFQLSDVPS